MFEAWAWDPEFRVLVLGLWARIHVNVKVDDCGMKD